MTKDQVYNIALTDESVLDVIETHISWVIIGSNYVYKIKKPVNFGFVDFTTLDKRKYYCEQELTLNNRLTDNMYLSVECINKDNEDYFIGKNEGEVIDYAVKMTRKDTSRQMHLLLEENRVKGDDVIKIATKIASFHKSADVIKTAFNTEEQISTFNDIETVKDFVENTIGIRYVNIINKSIRYSNEFIEQHATEFKQRVQSNMIRDCHGDLHSGNIFLEEEPVIFDCIEFNPAFRQIDLLYEVAFFCMDLDSFGRRDLAKLFMEEYSRQFPDVMKSNFDDKLFVYYKLCRANIKAKVIALKQMQLSTAEQASNELDELKRNLRLMLWYHHELLNLK
ncbi:MAG: hypothetical protein HKO56_07145 [Bacteroidia bacterium]|nr:hypothetical protein [Bacteroidia bacterium]NNC84872.1 hypothetical protein [Bacteroidia bacterium]NNM16416.1 hypothetical protein [Bacteroidia bacterium]